MTATVTPDVQQATKSAKTAAGGITVAGLLGLASALYAAYTKNGFNLDDFGAILATSGVTIGGVVAYFRSHSKLIDHLTTLAVAKAPELEATKADVTQIAGDVDKLLHEVTPGLADNIDAKVRQLRDEAQSARAELEGKIEQVTGATAEQLAAAEKAAVDQFVDAVKSTDLPAGPAAAQVPPMAAASQPAAPPAGVTHPDFIVPAQP